jgi:dTDP-glucose 4,6-dehydratase
MKILITGSEGTLGKPLVSLLEKRGHNVFGVDLAHNHKTNYMRADITESRQVEHAFETFKPDITYNLAAEFGRVNGEIYYEQLWKTNQIGNANIIKACLKYNSKFILAGSSEAYGDSNEPWLREEQLDTQAPLFHNQYALSKWAQEQQTFLAAKNDGLKAVVLRFFNSFGPGEFYSPYRSVVCLFCYRLMFGIPIDVYKNYHRVFMYVDDWANTVANVAERFDTLPKGNRPSGVPVYNIGGTEYRNIEELVAIVQKLLPVSEFTQTINYFEQEAHNVTNKRPDLFLATRDLGHNPVVSLEDGVEKTIEWLKKTYGN